MVAIDLLGMVITRNNKIGCYQNPTLRSFAIAAPNMFFFLQEIHMVMYNVFSQTIN